VSTAVTSRAAARTSSSTATPAITIAIAASSAGPPLARAFRTSRARFNRRNHSIDPVEIRFVVSVEIRAAFDHSGRCALRRASRASLRCTRRNHRRCCLPTLVRLRRRSATHLGALLFQNRLARQLDTVAFYSQNLHQDLVAFFQFVANIFDSVFGDFADVQ
jgi:hypothetical protein